MKTKKSLEFKKADIVELSSNQLQTIYGGTDETTQIDITSSLPCIADALSITGPIDPNGSKELCGGLQNVN